MNRTLGFFLGSAVVFGLLVLVLGQPVSLAPPANRDSQFAGKSTTVPIRIPAPIQHSEKTMRQPDDQAAAESNATTEQVAAVATAATGSSVVPTQANTVLEPVTRPVVVEYSDENKLAESWLETKTGPSPLPEDTTDLADANSVIATPETGTTTTTGRDVSAAPALSEAQIEWFPVWDPFHSELSANAFARRLERVTGLDYRVIRTGPAQYRVVMAYSSEEQRSLNLSLIEQATGLSITGGSL